MQTIGEGSSIDNRFNRLLRRIHALPLPQAVQQRLLTLSCGFVIPYLSTSAVEFEEVDATRAVLSLANRRRVQNHMKTVHASAMFLLAEAATGSVLSANLPEGSRFATTHIEIDYTRKAHGRLRAVASLDEAQRALLRDDEKGRLRIPVTLTDESGNEPARFTIEWSWKHAPRG